MLIAGLERMTKSTGSGDDDVGLDTSAAQKLANQAEATKSGDAPDVRDDAVDFCIESVAELQSILPTLCNINKLQCLKLKMLV